MGDLRQKTFKTSPCFPFTEGSILQLRDRESKAGTGNAGMGTGNGESLKAGILKMGNP